MKKLIALITAIVILIVLSACASKEEIADELIDYYNDVWIPIIVWKEGNIANPDDEILDIIFERGNESEETLTIRKEESLPVEDKAVYRFKLIQLQDEKLQKLNDLQNDHALINFFVIPN